MPVQDDCIRPGFQADPGIQEDRSVAVFLSFGIVRQEVDIILLNNRSVYLVKAQPANDILAFLPQLPESF